MNYFEFYPGDYLRDTADLSLAEHGAFLLLMASYYSAEKPLGADAASLYRVARAMNRAEQVAVVAVADRFFPVAEDGFRHNARVDIEIGKAQKRINSARENGGRGGRPPKPTNNPIETQQKPTGFQSANPVANPPETHSGEALQTPHAKREKKPKAPSAPPTALKFQPPDWIDPAAWAGYSEMRRKKRLPLTDRAAALVCTELIKLRSAGHEPTAVLDQSTRNGWSDVYPLKSQDQSNANRPSSRNLSAVEQVEWHIANNRRQQSEPIEGEIVPVVP